jgi:hypothetical protein
MAGCNSCVLARTCKALACRVRSYGHTYEAHHGCAWSASVVGVLVDTSAPFWIGPVLLMSNAAIFRSSVLVLLLFAAFSSASSLQNWYANLWLASASDQSLSCHGARTQIPWNQIYSLTSFQLPESCRCLCWDHALSLEFESIMLRS